MKVWLGVIGRACIEFVIILLLVSFAAGAAMFVATPSDGMGAIYRSSMEAALDLMPLAGILTLFLAFFSFEIRVKSRVAGWFGLFFLGALLLSCGIGVRRVPALREIIADSKIAATGLARLIPPGTAVQQGRAAVLIGSIEGGEALDSVAVDFGTDYPRLAYAPRSALDSATGDIDIQGRTYRAALAAPRPLALVPEASLFSGSWIWDRMAAMDGEPLLLVFAAVGGFLILAVGFRFLCRITGWPLANALLAAAGLAGLVILDAVLSGGALLETVESLAKRFGLFLPGPILVASIEGILGLVLCAADLAGAPRARRRLDE